jgi:hypothetical protein
MSKIAGIALIVAGVAAGAYVLPTATDSAGKELQASSVTAVPTLPKMQPATTTAAAPTLTVAPTPAVRTDVTKSGIMTLPEVPQKAPIETGTVTASAAQSLETPLPVPVARRLASAKPTDENARRQLTRDIQSELKRIGCYEGEASGEWTAATKKGMKSFIDRINATLPIEEPDHILKTLVQGHPGSACGKTCPAGQGLSGDRCVANAVLAQQQTAKRRAPNTRDVTPTPRETTVAQRPTPTKPTSQWETTVTAMAPFPMPAAPRAPDRSEPLAGRMALAGPAAGTTGEASSLSGSSSAKAAAKTEPADKNNETSSDRGPRSTKIAALPKTTDEDDDQSSKPAAKPKSEPKSETARTISKPSAPAPSYSPPRPRVVVYSAPVYSPPPQRERSTFNVSVFAKLARDGR